MYPLLQFLVLSPVTQRSLPFLAGIRVAGFFAGKMKVPVMAFSPPSPLSSIRVPWPQALSAHPSPPYRNVFNPSHPILLGKAEAKPLRQHTGTPLPNRITSLLQATPKPHYTVSNQLGKGSLFKGNSSDSCLHPFMQSAD